MDGIDTLRGKFLEQIAAASDPDALEAVRLAALGKKGEISLRMRDLGQMSPEDRQSAGPILNGLKTEIDAALKARRASLDDAALNARLQAEWLDVTLPGRPRPMGTIHPISQVMDELTAIFSDMGFAVAEGPQIESDWYNFDALNIAPEHPARQEHDTFFLHRGSGDSRPPHVLRTHTSPVQ
ncbi:MAG: phenylalanine--tRNA ligase subunit alpha, partial [Roseinatronobacter sp.]